MLTGNTYPGVIVDNFSISTSVFIDVEITVYNPTSKVWSESSETRSPIATHTLGGFPANMEIALYRDEKYYSKTASNETGVITWEYSGGFPSHSFEALRSYKCDSGK